MLTILLGLGDLQILMKHLHESLMIIDKVFSFLYLCWRRPKFASLIVGMPPARHPEE